MALEVLAVLARTRMGEYTGIATELDGMIAEVTGPPGMLWKLKETLAVFTVCWFWGEDVI
ncbi:hypothetical protein D3C76_1739110 [compost metagenome]